MRWYETSGFAIGIIPTPQARAIPHSRVLTRTCSSPTQPKEKGQPSYILGETIQVGSIDAKPTCRCGKAQYTMKLDIVDDVCPIGSNM